MHSGGETLDVVAALLDGALPVLELSVVGVAVVPDAPDPGPAVSVLVGPVVLVPVEVMVVDPEIEADPAVVEPASPLNGVAMPADPKGS